jgi:hypothetical protein
MHARSKVGEVVRKEREKREGRRMKNEEKETNP